VTPPRNDIRDDVPEDVVASTCPVCGAGFSRIRRQRFCSPACRQAAFRARSQPPPVEVPPVPATRRTQVTVYECGQCEQRYLGQQWCSDCNRPCTRIGLGGTCPHCDEPVAVDDLLPAHHDDLTDRRPGEPAVHQTRGGSNRCEYLRVAPTTSLRHRQLYAMRQDTESLNAQLERAFYGSRLPAWGVHNQTTIVLLAAMADNAWARHVWYDEVRRQAHPPGAPAA